MDGHVDLSSNAADQVLISGWNNTTRRFQFATIASNKFIIYERDSSSATQTHALNFVIQQILGIIFQ
jgi:hypothetical protein